MDLKDKPLGQVCRVHAVGKTMNESAKQVSKMNFLGQVCRVDLGDKSVE